MSKRTWVLSGAIGLVIVVAGLITWAVLSPPQHEEEPPTDPLAELGIEVNDHDHDHDDGPPANFGHGPYEPEFGDEAIALDPSNVPEAILDRAEKLGSVYMEFDSGNLGAERESQLSQAIANPGDWATHVPKVHSADGRAVGNPTWRTISAVTSPPVVAPDFSFGADGEYQVAVETSFDARFSSGGGNGRGSMVTTLIWSFVFDGDGNLIEVYEPRFF